MCYCHELLIIMLTSWILYNMVSSHCIFINCRILIAMTTEFSHAHENLNGREFDMQQHPGFEWQVPNLINS